MTGTPSTQDRTGAEVPQLWMNTNGMLVCPSHSGAGLRAAVKSAPLAAEHITDSDSWISLTPAEAADYWLACEFCH